MKLEAESGYQMCSMMLVSSLQYKIKKKPQKVYPKENKDPKVYPEYWRKPDAYKGDQHDTWDQIVRLEEILRTDDGPVLRLRKMYRPDDTHMSHGLHLHLLDRGHCMNVST